MVFGKARTISDLNYIIHLGSFPLKSRKIHILPWGEIEFLRCKIQDLPSLADLLHVHNEVSIEKK